MSKKNIGVVALCAAIVLVGIAAILPLLASAIGAFEIVALVQGHWDATWNDDDFAAAALTAAALLLLLAVSGGIGTAISRLANLPARRTVWLCVLSTVVIAAIGCVLVTMALHPS